MRGITKNFGALVANERVDFSLQGGEIQALLGENGAGKTTLMRILYGLYSADEGQIFVDGKEVQIKTPKHAIQAGIGMVTQHFTLVPTLTVIENVVLGHTRRFRLDLPLLKKEVLQAAERFGIEVKPDALVAHLSVGERQRVEILKSLYRDAHVLILDEPTAVLVPQEVESLFETLERLKKDGMSIVFISHKLNEVMAICDRITVLRDGRVIGTVEKAHTSQVELAQMMVGREMSGISREGNTAKDQALKTENLRVLNNQGLAALKDINLLVRHGEILGIAGVSGNGQTELAQVLSGMRRPSAGKIWIGDRDLTGATPAEFSAASVGRIPEDRHSGVVAELNVAENLALEKLQQFIRRGFLDRKSIQQNASRLIAEYQIKASPGDRMRTLSGGNVQKVLLARALADNPRVVIASQPTRGLDVGATEYVRSKLMEQRNLGAGVLMISEDLDEVMTLSDRIAVIYEGKIMGVVNAGEARVEQLGLMMSGAMEVPNGGSEN
jgi:simple sugar transport system ATP-binding protein